MYVGVTRAQRSLTISYAKARARFGRREEALPSRFLFELKGEAPPRDWVRAVRALAGGKSVRPAAKKSAKKGGTPARRRARRP